MASNMRVSVRVLATLSTSFPFEIRLPCMGTTPTLQVAVEHLNMLVELVSEMTARWEHQLEDIGEGSMTEDMLGEDGTDGKLLDL